MGDTWGLVGHSLKDTRWPPGRIRVVSCAWNLSNQT